MWTFIIFIWSFVILTYFFNVEEHFISWLLFKNNFDLIVIHLFSIYGNNKTNLNLYSYFYFVECQFGLLGENYKQTYNKVASPPFGWWNSNPELTSMTSSKGYL